MSDGETRGDKLEGHLARLERLTGELVKDMDGPSGPFLSVRVALRTPGGMRVDLDYDAEDAAGGETALELRGMSVSPGPGGIGTDDVVRLKYVLAATRPNLDGYSLGRAVQVADEEPEEA